MRIFLYSVFFILCLSNCGPPPNQECPANYYQNLTSYTVNPTQVTKSGVSVDSNYPIDLDDLDRRLGLIRTCIVALSDIEIDPEWQCMGPRVIPPLSCLTIKVVDPVPSCSTWQLLPIPAPDELCYEKGLVPTPECPCKWRTVLQNDYVVITPPAIYLWEVGRALTGCNNIWKSIYSKCAMF